MGAAHNNYVSMTSLYATAQTSTASEVSNASSSANAIGAAAASSTTAAYGGTYPLAEEAFLTEATSDVSPSSSPPPTPQEPPQYTDESADTCSSMTATEDEDPEQKRAWHQRLFKSASQVNRRDSDSSSSEQSRHKRTSTSATNGT